MTQTKEGTELASKPLPAGWKWGKVGDISTQDRTIVNPDSDNAKELPYLGLEHIESGTGKIFHAEMMDGVNGISTTFSFDDRHVLYGKLRPYLNKVALPDFKGRCTTEIIPLLPKQGGSREYLCWLLRRPETINQVMPETTGSRMPRADMQILMDLCVPIPPISEQKKIAAKINEQMAAVEKARAAAQAQLEAAKALPAAYLRQVFPSPDQPLPAGWKWVRLGNLCDPLKGASRIGPFGSSLRKDELTTSGIPVVGIENVLKNKFEPVFRRFISNEKYQELSDYTICPGDILISTMGTIGRAAVVPDKIIKSIIDSHLFRMRLSPKFADPTFICYAINGLPDIRRQMQEKSSGAIMAGLNTKILRECELPIPGVSMQKRIAAKIDEQMVAAENIRSVAEAQLIQINALPASILRKAFSGEL